MSLLEQYGIMIVGSGKTGRKLAVYANNASHCVTLVSGHRGSTFEKTRREWNMVTNALGDRIIFGSIQFVAPHTLKVQPFHGGPERLLIGRKVFIDLDDDDRQIASKENILIEPNATHFPQKLGLEAAGVELNVNGSILVDEQLETTASNTWAMGIFAVGGSRSRNLNTDFDIVKTHVVNLAENG
jgi:thioredoxin reductase